MSIPWNPFLGAFTAIYSANLSNDVMLRTAPALGGPWSDALRLFVAEHGTTTAYDALAHPALDEDGGRVVYVTYSRPTGETWFSARFPVVRVELAR